MSRILVSLLAILSVVLSPVPTVLVLATGAIHGEAMHRELQALMDKGVIDASAVASTYGTSTSFAAGMVVQSSTDVDFRLGLVFLAGLVTSATMLCSGIGLVITNRRRGAPQPPH